MKAVRFILLPALASVAAAAAPVAQKEPTFNRDVAPIVFANCVVCHHPGGVGPFALTTYREVKKRAKDIVAVTSSRYMPPWLPEFGHGKFVGERRLDEEQIATLARWMKSGAVEGNAEDLRVKAQWNDDWQLGPPDLVVKMSETYTLPAEGRDVYRNFVIPSVVPADRYVVAVEMRPGNPRAVHHAFLKIDRRGGSRRLAQKETEPGFPGMSAGPDAEAPAGTFASWQPGKVPERQPAEMAWVLPNGSDVVLQMHMRPTGKPEKIQASVGFYFTEHPPTKSPFVFCLRSTAIDLPAGAAENVIESSYMLPVEGDVLAVLPHLHYLGREVHAWAELPDGTARELILIKQWDFNWQGDYRYTAPVPLPKGAKLRMRLTYDNSAENPRNPNHPPQRVRYGPQSSDEMGEVWLQFLPRRDEDRAALERDYVVNFARADEIARARTMLERNPRDAVNRADLAAAYYAAGRLDDAAREAAQALRDNPGTARAHSVLGSIYAASKQVALARSEFAAVVALDPNDADAQNNLGFLLLVEGNAAEAITHLERALFLRPDDLLAQQNLEKARAARKK